MHHKLNSNSRLVSLRTIPAMLAAVVCICLSSVAGFCSEVPIDVARQVARGVLQHHQALFGHWNGSLTPTLGDGTIVRTEGEAVAYNFQVRPSGHVLVVVDDDLSPVPLYSTTSTFEPGRSHNPISMEAWIVPELKGRLRRMRELMGRAGNSVLAATQSAACRRINQAWSYFGGLADDAAVDGASRSLDPASGDIVGTAVMGPLLDTAWGQDVPYNLETPDDTGCTHTLTGCVATAWAQLLYYWKWPAQGQGSHSYDWVGPSGTETLTVDFSAATYDWANMPASLTGGSSQAQKNAVSLLLYHLGVATETDFGCDDSSSSLWADEVLDSSFKYKTLIQQANRLERENYSTAQWFDLFKTELDADPPRPVIFTIGSDAGWHEVVVDGYQQGAANMVHINFGWEDEYNGYYNINDDSDFNTGSFDWYVNHQLMVVGIEPDNPPPSVDAGSDQSVDEETDVQLIGSATDPAPGSTDIISYLWMQLSGPEVVINNATATTATLTTPNVHSETQLVFQLRAEDGNRAQGTDTVTITVSNTDGSVAPPPSARAISGGGSSGGCFVVTAFF